MTGAEALEAVAAGICGTDPCQDKCDICLRDAERAIKALKLDRTQAAALMSGEAVVVPKAALERALSVIGGEGKTRAIAQVRNAIAASPRQREGNPMTTGPETIPDAGGT